MQNSTIKTADLCDKYPDKVNCAEDIFKNFGQKSAFHGEIVTLKIFEDNTFVRTALEANGKGKVLVIDGGGSLRCALVGGNLGQLAEENGWEGIVVFGAIRDVDEIELQNIGIKTLGTCPVKSIKRNEGQHNVFLKFAGVEFTPGHYVYSDKDGILVSRELLQ